MAPISLAVALESLLTALSSLRVIGQSTRTVTGLAHDSRTVTPGTLFVALRGLQHDGHQFAAEAVERGAVAVVCESGLSVSALTAIALNWFLPPEKHSGS